MRRVELLELDAEAAAFDAAVEATPEVDGFCTSSAWVLPAHAAFHPEQEPFVFRGDEGWLVLARGHTEGLGRYLAPLEAMWGLASPVVGPDPRAVVDAATRALEARDDAWDALWLCGLVPRSEAFTRLAVRLGARYRLFVGPSTHRHVASLAGGYDGFLTRRSRKFRKNLRNAQRRAREAGVTFTWHDRVREPRAREALYDRCLAVDDRSWKGLSDQGLNAGPMARFYDLMTARLAEAGRLRVVMGVRDGEDVAMGFGGVFAGGFRGLQMSFDDRYRDLSLGSLVQNELIAHLCDEGVASYDLGTDIDYKRRWSEPGLETVALVVRK